MLYLHINNNFRKNIIINNLKNIIPNIILYEFDFKNQILVSEYLF